MSLTTRKGIERIPAFLVWGAMSVAPGIVFEVMYSDMTMWLRRRASDLDAFHAALWAADMMGIIFLASCALCFLVASIFVLASQLKRKSRILLIVLLPVLQWLVLVIVGVLTFSTGLHLDY